MDDNARKLQLLIEIFQLLEYAQAKTKKAKREQSELIRKRKRFIARIQSQDTHRGVVTHPEYDVRITPDNRALAVMILHNCSYEEAVKIVVHAMEVQGELEPARNRRKK